MEMKVWVEGIQRVVCGVTEKTTCQEIVIALAQATGKTGRFTLVEKWRDMERLVPPTEAPFKNVAKWGQYANDVTYFLRKSGSTKKRPSSAKPAPPERTFLRQSLPPKAVSKEGFANQRKEPLRKSLNSQVSAKAEFEAKEFQEKVTHHPDRSYDDLMKIVRFQQDKLNFQKCQLTKLDSEIRDYELMEETVSSNQSQELGRLESLGKEYERQLQSLEIVEMELARELAERDRLQTDITRVQSQIADTEKQLQQFLAKVDKLMLEIDQEKEKQKISNESAKEQEQQLSAEIQDLKKEIAQQLEEHSRYTKELSEVEEQIKDVENEINEKNKNLEVLGKELKDVNFQDFVKTTGYIVEVPPTATNGDSPPIADVDVPNKTTPTQDPKTQDTKTVLVTSRPNSARKILNPRELQSAVLLLRKICHSFLPHVRIDCSINQTSPNNCTVTHSGEILAKIAKAADGKKILPPLSPELGHAILARPGASLNLVHGPVGGGSKQFLRKSGYLLVVGALPRFYKLLGETKGGGGDPTGLASETAHV